MLIRNPALQELNRRVVAEREVVATPVVEDFNTLEQVGDGFKAEPKQPALVQFQTALS